MMATLLYVEHGDVVLLHPERDVVAVRMREPDAEEPCYYRVQVLVAGDWYTAAEVGIYGTGHAPSDARLAMAGLLDQLGLRG